ncbi:hypothetical protein JG688_00017122 [Phytophthora aleatoria]|uniref:RxLR effector protein n=1 Tax=Phytophthora aleatoria TaxID=2496075 RepID=A0A8J5IXH1_9STRA|nr:hypothetical protein JG688_00017122 [Phytophthora aleatoria]
MTPELSPVFAFADIHNGKRFLRTDTTEDEDVEERAATGLKIPALEEGGPGTSSARVQNWLKEGYEVDDVFVALKLDLVKGNIFESLKFKTWVKFATTLDKQNAGEGMTRTLTTKFGDVRLAKMLRFTNEGSTRAISTKVQRAQFDFWFKEGMRPRYIFRTFFKADVEAAIGKLGRSILGQYQTYLSKNHPDWSKNIYW